MMPFPNPRPSTSFIPKYDMRGSPMFIHPCAVVREDRDTRAHPAQQDAFSVLETPNQSHTTTPGVASTDPANARMMADMKISLAVKQVAEQAQENKKFWVGFREEFEKEVGSIKPYIDEHTLQQIWRKKIEHSNERGSGDMQHGGRFNIQNIKLETCMSQIDEAMKFLAVAESSYGNSTNHNPRRHHLEKIRAAGSLVTGLAKKSMLDEAACKDFLTELSDLERLLDPKNLAAVSLNRFDKGEAREAREATDVEGERPGKKNSGKRKNRAKNTQPITANQNEETVPNEPPEEPGHEEMQEVQEVQEAEGFASW
ncbi:hypothetical protein F5X99DRAFT_210447 [Biscogniauxia marginata]|nr:hypothetical protein F5X99DRAFT_210447 [Biscogniauxia marginata]